MILHLTFSDNSNPYVDFGEKKEIKKTLKKWQKTYEIEVSEKDDFINGYVHIPKPIDLFY